MLVDSQTRRACKVTLTNPEPTGLSSKMLTGHGENNQYLTSIKEDKLLKLKLTSKKTVGESARETNADDAYKSSNRMARLKILAPKLHEVL